MNWLLVAVLIFWGIIALTGFRKGFLRMLYSVSALIISLILTIALSPMVEKFVCEKTQFDEFLSEKYISFLDKEETDTADDNSYFENLTSSFVSDPDSFGLDAVVSAMKDDVENVAENAAETVGKITNDVIAMLAGKLASITISVLAFIITWIIISLLLVVLLGVIKIIEKIPVIKGVNRLLGFVLGSILALFIVWAVFALAAAIPTTELGIAFRKCIMENEFLKLINNTNIILKLI